MLRTAGSIPMPEAKRRRPFAVLAAAGLAATALAASATIVAAAEPVPTVIDFESEDGAVVNLVERTAASEAMPAASGCFFGAAPVTNYSTHGADGFVNTQYGGYTTDYPEGGYTASADFYLAGDAEQGQFSWSHAVNGTDGAGQRDFIFHADSTGSGTWTVGVSYTAGLVDPFIAPYTVEPLAIADEGWYTFHHTIRDQDGLLYADLAVLDAEGTELASWTLGGLVGDPIDEVGGNRYGWLINNPFEGLPMDNVLLDSERSTDGCGSEPTEPEVPAGAGEPATEQIVLGDATLTFNALLGVDPSGDLVLSSDYTDDPSTIAEVPADAQMSFGAFSFELNVEEGSTASVTLELDTPANTLFAYIDGEWATYTSPFSSTVITFEITDGGPGDLDGEVNGVIVSTFAPAIVATFTG